METKGNDDDARKPPGKRLKNEVRERDLKGSEADTVVKVDDSQPGPPGLKG